jgi:TRAP-type C4-dicarboxylate transport system substrate-binding protein
MQACARRAVRGIVPFATLLLSHAAARDAEHSAADLAGASPDVATLRRVVAAVGGQPLTVPFAQIVPQLRSGSLDCALTGTMSGHTIAWTPSPPTCCRCR